MHCGAEVTESSTNKQHHLSITDWKDKRKVSNSKQVQDQMGGGGGVKKQRMMT
jgi:hypothetical protein